MSKVEGIRSRIGILRDYVYLDNASSGPLSEPVIGAMREFIEAWFSKGEPWDDGIMAVLDSKRLFSSIVNASQNEVAAFPGVTYGLSIILSSLRLNRDSNIVVSHHNFPSNILIARSMASRGLIREVRVARHQEGFADMDVYEKLIDDNTAVVMVDYVGWLSGHMENLRELARIAHDHGALLATDAFHAVGVMPIDVKRLDVDVLITGSYKWLMSIHGAALAYIRGELVEKLEPPYAGWMAIEDSVVERILRDEPEFERPLNVDILKLARGASKLEWGTLPLLSFKALRESLSLIIEHDAPQQYENHTWRLSEYLVEELENLDYTLYTPRENHSAIVTFKHDNPLRLVEELRKKKIIVSARPKLVRISPHFYNTKEDIVELVEALKELRKKGF